MAYDSESTQYVIKQHKIAAFIQWLSNRWQARNINDNKQTMICMNVVYAMAIAEIMLLIPGVPTGLGTLIDFVWMTLLYGLFLVLITYILPGILSILCIAGPKKLYASMLMITIQTFIILFNLEWGLFISIMIAILITLTSLFMGIIVNVAIRVHWKWFLIILIGTCFIVLVVLNSGGIKDAADFDGAVMDTNQLPTVEIINEWKQEHTLQQPGPYEIDHWYYDSPYSMSVMDLRANREPLFYTESVEASSVLKDWSFFKEKYWGFDSSAIPMQGQLWMPKGDGPFPIVFVMHGNHIGEKDSSNGYSYLGELLASQGMIVISIDANFLNYSTWSGIVDEDQKLRAWLVLAQLQTFYKMSGDKQSIVYDKVDWDKVALIGHSRGGQAVAMIANSQKWFAGEEIASVLDDITIQGIVAIAPTDYTVDDKLAYIRDISYLTIHGSKDADLTQFFGERQYERTSFYDETFNFKAALTIPRANHGQFNMIWGKYDERMPAGLMLDVDSLISGEDQRQIAQIYISSFLHATLYDKLHYVGLFQDHRIAGEWLPDLQYVTRYADSNMLTMFSFEKVKEIESNWISYDDMEVSVIDVKGRNDTLKQNKALQIKWDQPGKVSLLLDEKQRALLSNIKGTALSISIADLKTIEEKSDEVEINIELHFNNEQVMDVDLTKSFHIVKPYYEQYLKINWFENYIKSGKYKQNIDQLLQTFIIPLSLFQYNFDQSFTANLSQLEQIKLVFKSSSGEVLVDEVAFMLEGGSYVEYRE